MIAQQFQDMFAAITTMMTTHSAFFVDMGQQVFRNLATIVLVWAALVWAWRGGVPMDRFITLVFKIAFGFMMLTFYSSPIPGIGYSFHRLVLDQGQYMANQLMGSMVDTLYARLNMIYLGLETPGLGGILNIMEIIGYAVTVLAIGSVMLSVFAVISLVYVSQAICVMIGPILIPFYIVPSLDFLFWNWLKAFIQCAFAPLTASAFVFVFATMLIQFVDRAGTDFAGPRLGLMFLVMVSMLMAFAYGIFKAPSINRSMFTGSSGESAWGF